MFSNDYDLKYAHILSGNGSETTNLELIGVCVKIKSDIIIMVAVSAHRCRVSLMPKV